MEQELVDAFPDAKVVLTVREPEKWSKSAQLILRGQDVGESFPERVVLMALRAIKKHKVRIAHCLSCFTMTGPLKLAGDLLIKKPSNNKLTMRGAVEGGEQTSKQFFDAWVEEVKRVVPAERLLIFQVYREHPRTSGDQIDASLPFVLRSRMVGSRCASSSIFPFPASRFPE